MWEQDGLELRCPPLSMSANTKSLWSPPKKPHLTHHSSLALRVVYTTLGMDSSYIPNLSQWGAVYSPSRSIVETPIRHQTLDLRYIKARVEDVDFSSKICKCTPAFDGPPEASGEKFELSYDYLVLAPGCTNNTFGTPGVAEHAMFVRNARDAKAIQAQIRNCFERASIPGLSGQESGSSIFAEYERKIFPNQNAEN